MSLHHLDPRQAGTEPDVEILTSPIGLCYEIDRLRRSGGPYSSPAAALRAAREAVGFGHVAEQPCDEYQPLTRSMVAVGGEIGDECRYCAWPKDRHGTGER